MTIFVESLPIMCCRLLSALSIAWNWDTDLGKIKISFNYVLWFLTPFYFYSQLEITINIDDAGIKKKELHRYDFFSSASSLRHQRICYLSAASIFSHRLELVIMWYQGNCSGWISADEKKAMHNGIAPYSINIVYKRERMMKMGFEHYYVLFLL